MLGTDFRTGSPNWLDLGSPDTTGAAAFYGLVFGWEFVPAGPDAGGYGFFRKHHKTVAALGPLRDEGADSAWMVYFRSPDIQATAKAVEQGGGTVRAEPMDVMGEGWMAQFTDPQGAEFALLPELLVHGHCNPDTWNVAEAVPDGPSVRRLRVGDSVRLHLRDVETVAFPRSHPAEAGEAPAGMGVAPAGADRDGGAFR